MTPEGRTVPFIADSAADAVAKIRAELGPKAIIVGVRKLPAEGLSRLWSKPRIEVLARLPQQEPPVDAATSNNALVVAQMVEMRREIVEMRRKMAAPSAPAAPVPETKKSFVVAPDVLPEGARFNFQNGLLARPEPPAPAPAPVVAAPVQAETPSGSLKSYLIATGLMPLIASRVEEEVFQRGRVSPASPLQDQLAVAERVLERLWRPAPGDPRSGLHVFIGPAGSGKSTSICKWLTQAVLVDGAAATVWRLDGAMSNTAEFLSVHAEVLGVPVERAWPGGSTLGDIGFVDLPGVDWRDAGSVRELNRQLSQFPRAHVHLVLNCAYETDTLVAQARAFSVCPVQDIIVTHVDEDSRRGKVWNLVLGTNCPVSFLAAGQNVPGQFEAASVRQILSHQFPRLNRANSGFFAVS